jgi:hypothetical protein
MFFEETAGSGPNNLSDIINNLQGQLKNMQSAILNFETQAKKVAADTFGQGANFAVAIRKELAASAKNAASLGLSIDDVANSLASVSNALGTNVMLSSKQLDNMLAFQEATNISAESMGKLIEGFATIGVGTNDAIKSMSEMRKQANAFGLNTAKFMETVADNIKLTNSYNFRDGVEGFTRMVARSQALRINMTDVKGLAVDLLNPEKAVELAASMQMLGGSVAGLSDPFQLMNMAQNDMEGLQNAIIDTAASSVSFNEQTGKFNISATEMRRLRAQAQALSMDYEELANTAIKSRQKQEALGQLRFTNLSEEEQEFLSNIGQFEGGELKFKVPGVEELVAAQDLTDPQIEELKKLQEASSKTDKQIAIEQLTALQAIQAILLQPVLGAQGFVAGSEFYESMTRGLVNTATSVSGATGNILTEENIQTFLNTRDNILGDFRTNIEGATGIGDVIGAVTTAASSAVGAAVDATFGSGTADTIGDAVEQGVSRALRNSGLNVNVDGTVTIAGMEFDITRLSPTQQTAIREFILRTIAASGGPGLPGT